MSGLFTLNWREDFTLDQIKSIRTFPGQNGAAETRRVYLRDEEGHDLGEHAYQRLAAHPLQLLPAEPGIQALAIEFEGGKPVVDKTPVIAWALCFDGSVRIVTPAGVDDGHLWKEGGGYVLMPDGTVQSVTEWLDVTRFANLAAYIDHHARGLEAKLGEAE